MLSKLNKNTSRSISLRLNNPRMKRPLTWVLTITYILDGLLKNRSNIQPNTIYGDSHAQSATAFGLSYLLGIKLMPRIKNWRDLTLYKPSAKERYKHIEPLFSGETIDWKLIETNLPEMLRVAISVKAGKLNASTVLKRLGSYSRKNKLYFAFREVGRAVRTTFLLNYISDPELRALIQAGINKSEGFNYFTQWVAFGGDGVIAENDREQQRKIIAYNHLASNCIIFHTINGMTKVIQELVQEGFPIDKELLASLSPFITKHINRFGDYTLDLERTANMANYDLRLN